jgi:hypothetical protein
MGNEQPVLLADVGRSYRAAIQRQRRAR